MHSHLWYVMHSIHKSQWPTATYHILVKLPWIFLGAPFTFNGAPGNIQGNLTGIILSPSPLKPLKWTGARWPVAISGVPGVSQYDDVIKWKHFMRHWPFVRGIYRSPVNFPHKCQWRGALMLPLICAWTNGRVNYRDGGDLRRHLTHYDVTVMNV